MADKAEQHAESVAGWICPTGASQGRTHDHHWAYGRSHENRQARQCMDCLRWELFNGDGCEVHPVSSRVCELGTKSCDKRHALIDGVDS